MNTKNQNKTGQNEASKFPPESQPHPHPPLPPPENAVMVSQQTVSEGQLRTSESNLQISKIWLHSPIPPIGESTPTLNYIENTSITGRNTLRSRIFITKTREGISVVSENHKRIMFFIPLSNIKLIEFIDVTN